MTLNKFLKLYEKYNIDPEARLMSDSGWEIDATEMDGIYYNKEKNLIIFTQEHSQYERYDPDFDNGPFQKEDQYIGFIRIE